MRTEGLKTRIENRRIDNTIELAKISVCLRKFQKTGDSIWFDRAKNIAEANELSRIASNMSDPVEYVFRPRNRCQLQLL